MNNKFLGVICFVLVLASCGTGFFDAVKKELPNAKTIAVDEIEGSIGVSVFYLNNENEEHRAKIRCEVVAEKPASSTQKSFDIIYNCELLYDSYEIVNVEGENKDLEMQIFKNGI